jgi:hypothetical protein
MVHTTQTANADVSFQYLEEFHIDFLERGWRKHTIATFFTVTNSSQIMSESEKPLHISGFRETNRWLCENQYGLWYLPISQALRTRYNLW